MVEQTRSGNDEKIAMYMRSTKRELAEMLANCNEALARHMDLAVRDFRAELRKTNTVSWTGHIVL